MSESEADPQKHEECQTTEQKTIRVVTMAGGGIYGLATAIFLRKLCEKRPKFLSKEENVWLFSGTSAGAINALLLAKHEEPREFILDGGLERFWFEPGTYTNKEEPLAGMLSYFGITAWLGKKDFRQTLSRYFGNLRLRDLKQNILVPVMDWSASRRDVNKEGDWQPKFFKNFPRDCSDRDVLVSDLAYYAAAPPGVRPIYDGYGDGGTFVPDPVLTAIVEVFKAWQSQALPYSSEDVDRWGTIIKELSKKRRDLRKLRPDDERLSDEQRKNKYNEKLKEIQEYLESKQQDIYDLYQFNIDEMAEHIFTEIKSGLPKKVGTAQKVIALLTDEEDTGDSGSINRINERDRLVFTFMRYLDALQMLASYATKTPYPVLEKTHVLSLGVGTRVGSLWLKDFNLGALPFASMPTNPFRSNFFPPALQIQLDAPSEDTHMHAQALLGTRYHRLSPPLFGPPSEPPVIVAMMMARFAHFREQLIKRIYDRCQSNEALRAIDRAADYLEGTTQSGSWTGSQSRDGVESSL